ncbi:MAG: preprotein translocase subunit YajC [Anaerolineae bacterium]|nr:preprotein translocase subunit YajC [Candidatus Roseilinea sp.]MDW8451012.1 preprotein translocase subunit YajC [Anaerolineae bacterium]
MDLTLAVVVLAITIAFVFILVWVIVVVPQNRARKNQERVIEELKIGEQIVTVGGVIGKLTYLNREEDLARIEVAPGVEIRIIPAAISHPLDYMQRLARMEQEASQPKAQQKARAKEKPGATAKK